MKNKIVLILGASGSVGFEILQAALKESSYSKVVVFVRQRINLPHTKLTQKIVPDLTPEHLAKDVAETIRTLASENPDAEFFGFSALGVGAKTAALTLDQHRAIDVELNRAFARALKESGKVFYMALLSSVGANPTAKTTGSGAAGMARYLRVKGESEEAVKSDGPRFVGIFRPATIRGSRHTPKVLSMLAPLLDPVLPRRFHSVSTEQIAQAMVASSLKQPIVSATYTYPEMIAVSRL